MFKRKLGQPKQGAGNEEVVMLPVERDANVAFEAVWSKAKKGVERVVEAYARSTTKRELAAMNDMFLRTILRLPETLLLTPANRELFVDKIISEARAYISKNYPGDPAQAFGGETTNLRSSLLQLTRFVVSERQRSPDNWFATSVDLDVDYGIDLIKIRSWWNDNAGRMDVQVFPIQAKASKAGLEDQAVREVAATYRPKAEAVRREFTWDRDWLFERMLERAPGLSRVELEKALTNADRALVMIEEMGKREPASSYERFMRRDRRYRLSQVFPTVSGAVGEPVLRLVPEPAFRFLVDARSGTKILTEEEALQYPKPVAQKPPAPLVDVAADAAAK